MQKDRPDKFYNSWNESCDHSWKREFNVTAMFHKQASHLPENEKGKAEQGCQEIA